MKWEWHWVQKRSMQLDTWLKNIGNHTAKWDVDGERFLRVCKGKKHDVEEEEEHLYCEARGVSESMSQKYTFTELGRDSKVESKT